MEDEDEAFGGAYENGNWLWNEKTNCLEYISTGSKLNEDHAILSSGTAGKGTGGKASFRDDIDVIEQIRFRRRYQRKVKPGEPDIITLQDVKDLALYTAPLSILSASLIDLLHQRTTERFLRALILYCQYYLQILDEMNRRKTEGLLKIRTAESDALEAVYKNNLSDLRLLIGKEYSIVLMGGSDTTRFHHMGETKKSKSLTKRDARLHEDLLQMCVQIVWLALGRTSFNQLELEIYRLFKSEMFNSIEHNLQTGYIEKMTPQERKVFLGNCLRREKKLFTRSPLQNEIFCGCKEIDFTMMGIGAIAYHKLTSRITYMANAIAAPEEMLIMLGVTLGIIGMDRNKFDIMLRPLPESIDKSSKESKFSSSSCNFRRISSVTAKKSVVASAEKSIYPDVVLPVEGRPIEFPPSFPDLSYFVTTCCYVQRNVWQNRLRKLLRIMKNKSS